MPIVQFRNLGSKGILHDPSAADLPEGAWSSGSNVRFDGLRVSRAPVFRVAKDSLSYTPAFVVGRRPSSGYDLVFTAADDGRLFSLVNGTETEVTPAGFTPVVASNPFTSTYLGDVTYISRPTDVPFWWSTTSTAFATMSGWDPTWRCAALRSYKDYLIALNVTKGSVAYPQMVKTSSNTLAGLTPSSWDATDPTTNASENILADLTSPLIDGAVMRDAFILYSSEQVWSMQAVTTNDVFTYERLFTEGGIINQNCVVEVDGHHFVFGPSDVYAHDGVSKKSIIDQRNKRFLFSAINMRYADRCFMVYKAAQQEIILGYVSGDPDAVFTSPTGCNRAAIYNIVADTWTFDDLPNVVSMSVANLNTQATWADSTTTWAAIGGSWYDQTDSFGENIVAVSQALSGQISQNRILAWDFMDTGSLALPFVEEINPPAWVSREYLDLDTLPTSVGWPQQGATLNVYKTFNRFYPQVRVERPVLVTIQVGATLTPAGQTVWKPAVTFDPVKSYKADVRGGGRYLAIRFSLADAADFALTGFDVETGSGGNR